MLTVGSLFTGIGGIDAGLERAGMRIAWQCEIDDWCRRVLAKHWPDTHRYTDIRGIRSPAACVDVLAGGFPCQPVSLAGRGLAQADERWLWPEFARLVRLLRPRYVLVENVPGLLARGMGDVLGDLAACGYDAEWDCIGAVDVGAPHRRKRVWIVAYPHTDRGRRGGSSEPDGAARWQQGRPGDGTQRDDADRPCLVGAGLRLGPPDVADASSVGLEGCQQAGAASRPARRGGHVPDADSSGCERQPRVEGAATAGRGWAASCSEAGDAPDTDGARLEHVREGEARIFGRPGRDATGDGRIAGRAAAEWWSAEPAVGRVAHGVPHRVDRLRGLGNAVVPQVVEWIGRRMIEADA